MSHFALSPTDCPESEYTHEAAVGGTPEDENQEGLRILRKPCVLLVISVFIPRCMLCPTLTSDAACLRAHVTWRGFMRLTPFTCLRLTRESCTMRFTRVRPVCCPLRPATRPCTRSDGAAYVRACAILLMLRVRVKCKLRFTVLCLLRSCGIICPRRCLSCLLVFPL